MENFLPDFFNFRILDIVLGFLNLKQRESKEKIDHFIKIQAFAERILAFSALGDLPLTLIKMHVSDEDELNLDGFYNLTHNPDRTIEPERYRNLKFPNLACALLLVVLEEVRKRKMISEKGKITLLAKGKGLDQRNLAKFYQQFGFKADPNYLERYSQAMAEIDKLPRGKLISKYDLDPELGIPMEGPLLEVIEGLKQNCPRKIESFTLITNNNNNEKFENLNQKIEKGEENLRFKIFENLDFGKI